MWRRSCTTLGCAFVQKIVQLMRLSPEYTPYCFLGFVWGERKLLKWEYSVTLGVTTQRACETTDEEVSPVKATPVNEPTNTAGTPLRTKLRTRTRAHARSCASFGSPCPPELTPACCRSRRPRSSCRPRRRYLFQLQTAKKNLRAALAPAAFHLPLGFDNTECPVF